MKHLFIFLPFILLAACSASTDRVDEAANSPDSIIPEGVMVLMLADAHTIEAALLIARNRGTSTEELGNYYYSGLFRKYGVSRERYQQNLDYYRDDPDRFILIYEQVNRELTKREKDFVKDLRD